MFDGSRLPWDENLAATARVVADAPDELWVEAELG
jgi:fructose/tagatose bisphosphate aldolase